MAASKTVNGEKSLLLQLDGDNGSGTYGIEHGQAATQKAPDTTGAPSEGGERDTNGKKRGWWKGERIFQRNPSLDKVDEDFEQDVGEDRPPRYSRKLFGVKSYLDHFYESKQSYKDPEIYEDEDDDFQYLLHPRQRRRRCTSIWWKVFVWIGANFLIFGIVGVLVGYLVPHRQVFLEKVEKNVAKVDPSAEEFNYKLDVCKLIGLILFCVGGLTLAVALLFPSFLYHYCDPYEERERRDDAFKVRVGEKTPRSPLEMQVPASTQITGIQPGRKEQESVVTKEGMFKYTE